jgi:hypothetical protein
MSRQRVAKQLEVIHFLESKEKYFKIPGLTLARQKVELERVYPDSAVHIHAGKLEWSAIVKPTVFSKEYEIKIEYKMERSPIIWLVGVDLDPEDAQKIPHKYEVKVEEKKVRLCLFMPKYKEWDKYMFIADTIVPWTIEWLYFYEIWQITGEWKGGGEHPQEIDCSK